MELFAITCLWISSVLYLSHLAYCADVGYMRKSIEDYFSDTRHHIQNPTYKQRAREFIFNEFKRYGLDPVYQKFTTDETSGQVHEYFNVIGVLHGDLFGTAADKILGVGAHYDTVATTKGVDDNGSGCAALLEVARQISQQNANGVRRNNTIVFIAFDMEEYDLLGSTKFISGWQNKWLVESYGSENARKIVPYGVIVLETLMNWNTSSQSQKLPNNVELVFPEVVQNVKSDGYQGDFLVQIYRNNSGEETLAQTFKQQWIKQARPQFELERFGLPMGWEQNMALFSDFLRSDHASFWIDNVPAIMITDSANFRGDMVKCYHEMCDNKDFMLTDENLNFLGKSADTVAATLDQLSFRTSQGKINGIDPLKATWHWTLLAALIVNLQILKI